MAYLSLFFGIMSSKGSCNIPIESVRAKWSICQHIWRQPIEIVLRCNVLRKIAAKLIS